MAQVVTDSAAKRTEYKFPDGDIGVASMSLVDFEAVLSAHELAYRTAIVQELLQAVPPFERTLLRGNAACYRGKDTARQDEYLFAQLDRISKIERRSHRQLIQEMRGADTCQGVLLNPMANVVG